MLLYITNKLSAYKCGYVVVVRCLMKSMTGYGKATVSRDNRELTVELKSVNHRFLDISTKIPRSFIAYEDVIRGGLSQGLTRGHVDVFINYSRQGDSDKTVTGQICLLQQAT